MADLDRKIPLPPRPRPGKKDGRKPKHVVRRSFAAAAKASSSAVKGVTKAPSRLLDHINRELYKRNAELAARNKTLALLRTLDEISLADLKVEEIAQKITAVVAQALGYDLVSIALVNSDRKVLQWIAIASPVPWIKKTLRDVSLEKMVLPLDEHLGSLDVVQKQEAAYADDLHKLFPPFFVDKLSRAAGKGDEIIEFSLLYPLRYGRPTLGLLTLSSSRPLRNLSQYERDAVTNIVGLIALALHKANLHDALKRTTLALGKANDQLKELDKLKTEFLSIASHQLYTPLTALRGYLSMIREGDFGKVPEKQQPIYKILEESSSRLIELIKSMLDISRIESGRLELNLESADLAEMTGELIRDLLPNAQAKNLELIWKRPTEPLPHVVVDKQRIRQVMLNFIDNAIKYTSQGWIKVSIKQVANQLLFSVEDSGKGISKEDIKKLFTKFTRVGGSDRYQTQGTGLGLYVAKRIVQEHHGDVDVQSKGIGQGSTFSVRLPIEGTPNSLAIGKKTEVAIKAAESDNNSTQAGGSNETKNEEAGHASP